MLRQTLEVAVDSAIRSALAPIEVQDILLVEGQNYRAEGVLFITVNLPAGTGPLPAPKYMEMLRSVGHVLLQAGEERAPQFRTVREDDEEPLESLSAGGR